LEKGGRPGMLLDVVVSGAAWAVLAWLFRLVAGLPWWAASVGALAALLGFDWVLSRGRRDRGDREEVAPPVDAGSIMASLRSLAVFLLFGLLPLGGLFAADLYLEAGGARLALPNFAWPKELKALLALVGLPAGAVTFPVLLGTVVALANMAGPLVLAHFAIAFWSNLPDLIAVLRKPGGGEQGRLQLAEVFNLSLPLLVVLSVGVLLYGAVFPAWSYPLAQLQMAHALWQADFEPSVAVDSSIIGSSVKTPDFFEVYHRHEGEFSALLVRCGPVGLLYLHLLVALVAEVYFLHLLQVARQIEQRQGGVVRMARLALQEVLGRVWEALCDLVRRLAASLGGLTVRAPRARDAAAVPVGRDHAATLAGPNPAEATDTAAAVGTEGAEADPPPEEQPVRVAGTGEFVTPREALKHPQVYRVERVCDGSREYYRIALVEAGEPEGGSDA